MFRVLVIDTWPPAPDRDAASLQVVRLLDILRRVGGDVTFASGEPRPFQSDYTFAPLSGERAPIVGHDSIRVHLESDGARYDLIWLIRHESAHRHLDDIRRLAPSARLVFDTQDLAYVRDYRASKVLGRPDLVRSSFDTKRVMSALVERCDVTTVVSESERAALLAEHPDAHVAVVPLIFDPAPTEATHAERSGLAFVGNFTHEPNADAIRHAFEAIVPLIRAVRPALPIGVIGSHIPDWLADLDDPSTTIHGHVPDLRTALGRYRMTFAPIRFGAGVNGKVLFSMAVGVPTVVSESAAEGIAAHGEGLVIASSPEGYAAEVLHLDEDPAHWAAVRSSGLEVVRTRHSAIAVERIVRSLLADLAIPMTAARAPRDWANSPAARAAAIMGRHWMRRGKLDVAVAHLEEAVTIEPIEMAYEDLLEIHTARGDTEAARDVCVRGVAACGSSVHLHKGLLELERSSGGFEASLDLYGLRQLSAADVRPRPGAVIAGAIVRNERLRLPWFLDELRRIGVDEIFVVDNASTDGSTDYLLAQPDVHVWSTAMAYRDAAFGTAWMQAVVREYALGHWLLLLDADEIVCYPGYETSGVRAFCDELDDGGMTAASGLFIDMYSDRSVQDTHYSPGSDFLDVCPYFDRVPYTDAVTNAGDFKNGTLYTGGARLRTLGNPTDASGGVVALQDTHFWLTKTPFVRYDADVVLGTGQHFTSHPTDRIAHDACAVLHFKHFSSLDEQARTETARGEHTMDALQYRAYLAAVAARGSVTFFDERLSERFEGSATLTRLGLVRPLAGAPSDSPGD